MTPIDAKTLEVTHNTAENRFEAKLGDDAMGVIDYHKQGSVYVLTHTGVPEAYNGQGIAGRIAQVALDTIKAEGGQIVPQCPYIVTYLKRHPEYAPLVKAD